MNHLSNSNFAYSASIQPSDVQSDVSPVQMQTIRLGGTVDAIEERVMALAVRLEPYLRTAPESNSSAKPTAGASCSFHSGLISITEHASCIDHKLADLIDRLQI